MRRVRLTAAPRWVARTLAWVISVSLIVGGALTLHTSQATTDRGIADRFTQRAQLAADFTGTYVDQLTARERHIARRTLTGPRPTANFAADVRGFGFAGAVLLDRHGRDLAIAPRAPRLVGTQIAARYPHLVAALHGSVSVSNVILTAARQKPAVGFAVPFATPEGRRVFSGGYAVSSTPLAAYLSHATSIPGARLYLVDGGGVVVASNASGETGVTTLQHFAPELANAAAKSPRGRFDAASTEHIFARVGVPGTRWSLVLAAPTASVFAATTGTTHWLPWLILGLLSFLLVAASMLTIRLIESRYQLSLVNGQLVEIARTDVLTGLSNRRSLVEQLETLLANASRHRFPVCVLMVDIDHFKQINDSFGHSAGDRAIRHVASLLAMHRREGDLIARWGGEEFLAVLPYSSLRDSISAANRLCRLVEAEPVVLDPNRDPVTLRVSIGVALAGDGSIDAVIDRADLGLYQAKAAGRHTVRTVDPLDATTASYERESSARQQHG